MKFRTKIVIGNQEIEIEDEAVNNKDLLKKVSFFSNLPKEGPTGNKNLIISHRTPKNYEYFSIIDEEAKKEFKFGTKQDSGELFPKGWEDLYVGGIPREESPDLVQNAKAVHKAKEVMKEEEKPASNDLNDVLAKYGIGK